VGHNRQEKAADELVCGPGPDLDAMALASVTAGQAPLPVVPIANTVGGDGHAVGVAPARVEHLRRACQRPLGLDHPPLVLEGGEEALQALACVQGGRVRSAYQGIPAGVEGSEALPAEDRAQSLHRK
jgi:hypothetical protein